MANRVPGACPACRQANRDGNECVACGAALDWPDYLPLSPCVMWSTIHRSWTSATAFGEVGEFVGP